MPFSSLRRFRTARKRDVNLFFLNATCASLIHMRLLVPLIAALVPLVIAPGLLAYFDVTPKIAFLLIGTALILLYRSANIRNISSILQSRIGRWWVALLAAQWLSSAIATVFSTHPALSLNGGNWRRFGLISETGLLLFVLIAGAWVAADRLNLRTLLRATTAAGSLGRALRNLAILRLGPVASSHGLPSGRGPLHHRSATRYPRTRRLFRCLAAGDRILQPGARSPGRIQVEEGGRTDCGNADGVRNRPERHSFRDARTTDRRNRSSHRRTSPIPRHRGLIGFCGRHRSVLLLAPGSEVESAAALVARRHPRRRQAVALARLIANGGAPSDPRRWPRILHHGISAL